MNAVSQVLQLSKSIRSEDNVFRLILRLFSHPAVDLLLCCERSRGWLTVQMQS